MVVVGVVVVTAWFRQPRFADGGVGLLGLRWERVDRGSCE